MTKEERILDILREGDPLSGAELQVRAKLWSGTLYPILYKLESSGRIKSEWEEGEYPRRRLYAIRNRA